MQYSSRRTMLALVVWLAGFSVLFSQDRGSACLFSLESVFKSFDVASSLRHNLQNHTKALRGNYEALVKLEASMKAQMNLLQNGQQGARLTSAPKLVAQFVGVGDEFEELTRYDLGVESFLSSMNGLLASVVEERAARDFSPQTETVELAQQFDKSVLERKKSLTELSAGLESLLAGAQENKPRITLAVAIANAKKERANIYTKRKADFSRQAREESWGK